MCEGRVSGWHESVTTVSAGSEGWDVSTALRRIGTVPSVVRAVVDEVRRRDVTFLAGSIAYSAFVSLLPLLLLVLLLASAIGDQAMAAVVVSATEQYLTPAAQNLVTDALGRASGQIGFSVLNVLVLVWGVLGLLRSLDTAFSKLYGTTSAGGFVDQVTDGLVVLVGIGVAIVAMAAAGTVYALFAALPFVRVVNLAALVVALALAFFPIFYVFPDADVSLAEVVPGVLVAAIGWTVLQALFQVYVSYSSAAELYGVLGGVILLITWLYFGALVVLLGAATNVVLADRTVAV